MLGLLQTDAAPPKVPRFCKPYANVGWAIQQALGAFKRDVETGEFPGTEVVHMIGDTVNRDRLSFCIVAINFSAGTNIRKHNFFSAKL